jgi:RimJ/RimL family protein N-acetyltransferase
MQRNVQIRQLNPATLQTLLDVAVADAAPDETMPPMPGNPGWTSERKATFLEFFEPMLAGWDGPKKTIIYAITVDETIAGFIRLSRTPDPQRAETGIWLGRSWRGQGVATAALKALIAQAKENGITSIVADTSPENVAALGALRSLGATLRVHAELHL